MVAVHEIIVCDLDYQTISTDPYVYDKKSGYISIQAPDGILTLWLDSQQIKLIEDILAIKN